MCYQDMAAKSSKHAPASVSMQICRWSDRRKLKCNLFSLNKTNMILHFIEFAAKLLWYSKISLTEILVHILTDLR